MSIKRALRRGGESSSSAQEIGESAARIYKLLWEGQYLDGQGRRVQMKGDVSKISQIIGLSTTEKALLQNYHFMSSRLAGTRQIRSSLRHLVFSSRIFYGQPVFLSFTPSERHSGLALHLHRGRRNDPAYASLTQMQCRCLGHDYPSLCPQDAEDSMEESVVVDLPD